MKNVLFIAYDFQPTTIVGGSIRSTKFARYIQELGWKPIVLALNSLEALEQGELFNSVYRFKSLTPFFKPYQITAYGWAVNLWFQAKKIAIVNKLDVIYVACPPFPQTITAVLLKRRLNIPLVLDFRDNWSLDPYQEGSRFKKIIYKYIFPFIEKWVFKNADRIILNTPSSLVAYQKLYPKLARKMDLITNGYDENDFVDVQFKKVTQDYMQLLYSGSFGVCGRDARNILDAVKKAKDNGMKLVLRLLGNQPGEVYLDVQELELENVVLFDGQVSHNKAIQYMYESDILVLYQESPKVTLQTIAGKTFEYIRTGTPILSIAPKGDNQDLIRSYAINYQTVTSTTVDNIYMALITMHDKWKSEKLGLVNTVSNEFKHKYERKRLAECLVNIFNFLTK